MIDPGHGRLGIARQCSLVSISRSSFYYQGEGEAPVNLNLMRLIDAQFLETPCYGSRQMARHLRLLGYCVGRKRVRRLMRLMGLQAIYQAPKGNHGASDLGTTSGARAHRLPLLPQLRTYAGGVRNSRL